MKSKARCKAKLSTGAVCECLIHTPKDKYCTFHLTETFKGKPILPTYYNLLAPTDAEIYVKFLEAGNDLEHEIAMIRTYIAKVMEDLESARFIRDHAKTGELFKLMSSLNGNLRELMKTQHEITGDKTNDSHDKAYKVVKALEEMEALRKEENA